MFIDEAYQLCQKNSLKTHGEEAVETIMRHMNPSPNPGLNFTVFIFAGYPADMANFVKSVNKGISRRIKERFEFAQTTLKKMLKQKLNIRYGIEKTLSDGFSQIPKFIRSEHNGSLCEDLYRSRGCVVPRVKAYFYCFRRGL